MCFRLNYESTWAVDFYAPLECCHRKQTNVQSKAWNETRKKQIVISAITKFSLKAVLSVLLSFILCCFEITQRSTFMCFVYIFYLSHILFHIFILQSFFALAIFVWIRIVGLGLVSDLQFIFTCVLSSIIAKIAFVYCGRNCVLKFFLSRMIVFSALFLICSICQPSRSFIFRLVFCVCMLVNFSRCIVWLSALFNFVDSPKPKKKQTQHVSCTNTCTNSQSRTVIAAKYSKYTTTLYNQERREKKILYEDKNHTGKDWNETKRKRKSRHEENTPIRVIVKVKLFAVYTIRAAVCCFFSCFFFFFFFLHFSLEFFFPHSRVTSS